MDTLLSQLFSNVMMSVGLLIVIIGSGLVLILNRKLLDKALDVWDKIYSKFKGPQKIGKETQDIIANINIDLSALRGLMDADRTYIVEFHNGSHFASKIPQWRLSKTYERVTAGITYESHRLQNVSVSLVWDYLEALFSTRAKSKLPAGMTPITDQDRTLSCDGGCSALRRVYLLDVNKMDMDAGPLRAILEQQGVEYSLITPIINSEKGVIGYVGVEYCDKGRNILEDDNIDTCDLCKFSSQIALVWELNKGIKKKMMAQQKILWNKLS